MGQCMLLHQFQLHGLWDWHCASCLARAMLILIHTSYPRKFEVKGQLKAHMEALQNPELIYFDSPCCRFIASSEDGCGFTLQNRDLVTDSKQRIFTRPWQPFLERFENDNVCSCLSLLLSCFLAFLGSPSLSLSLSLS